MERVRAGLRIPYDLNCCLTREAQKRGLPKMRESFKFYGLGLSRRTENCQSPRLRVDETGTDRKGMTAKKDFRYYVSTVGFGKTGELFHASC